MENRIKIDDLRGFPIFLETPLSIPLRLLFQKSIFVFVSLKNFTGTIKDMEKKTRKERHDT